MKLAAHRPAMYQAKTHNNNNPFPVKIIKLGKKTAIVSTYRLPTIEFKCRISSLYPATPYVATILSPYKSN